MEAYKENMLNFASANLTLSGKSSNRKRSFGNHVDFMDLFACKERNFTILVCWILRCTKRNNLVHVCAL